MDIQSIAVQISKLRFFISLICDCEKDENKPNFGIPTLPNLETKFVCANSLIDKKSEEAQGNLFEDPRIQETKDALIRLREDHFLAKSASQKRRLREKDDELRLTLATLLADNDLATREDAEQMAKWNPYDQNASSPFFSAEWMFNVKDGFDIIIGNPPYIQLQNNGGELNKLYAPCGFQSFASTGDIYCLFYERGWQLLKENGHLCFITSNKWMRAGYGEKLRTFFANNTDPKLMIDFGGVKIFESATVDTNILLYEKSKNTHHTRCAVTNKQNKDSINNLSVFVQQQGTFCDFSGGDSWVILSPIEQSIKRKIEAVGTPLKDWDINIYRGVLTGYNDAFIITTSKRDEILSNCQNEDERKRTAELIRPILRGRDIKRYGYEWANLWLINTHNGIKGKLERIHIEDYSAVKAHLDQFWDKIKDRADQGDTPYNLRNCAYLEDFKQPKILFQEIVQESQFMIDTEGTFFCNDTGRIIVGEGLYHLLGVLNSSLFFYAIKTFYGGGILGDHGVRMKHTFFEKFPCLPISEDISSIAESLTHRFDSQILVRLEKIIFKTYGLTNDEVNYIYESTNQ